MMAAFDNHPRKELRRNFTCGSRLLLLLILGGCLATASVTPCQGQAAASAEPEGSPLAWVQVAVTHETAIIGNVESLPIRFRQRKIDAHGDTTREIIQAREGAVARLIERNGQPITAAEDAAERDRLNDVLSSPDAFLRHHHHDRSSRDDAIGLVKLLPQAMLYSYTPYQPQLQHSTGSQVVIDFHPDPKFHPPTLLAELLTGIEGRVWIDQRTGRMVHIEGHVLKPVNFGFGLLAKIYPGGTISLDQAMMPNGDWVYSRAEEHLNVRALLVHNAPQNQTMTSFDFRLMPQLPGFEEATRELLSMRIPLR
jgi:hypothetical protein